MNKTFEFDVADRVNLMSKFESMDDCENEASWFNVNTSKEGHEKRKSLSTKVLVAQQAEQRVDEQEEHRGSQSNEPASKRAKIDRGQQMNTTGFKFVLPKIKGNTTKPEPFSFIKREEERKRLKMEKQNESSKNVQIDEAISTKRKLKCNGIVTKKRGFSTSRLNELAKPKVRPRMKDDMDLKPKTFTRIKLETVLACPPPIQKSTLEVTKVTYIIKYKSILII